jgi:hypothetical protein
VQAGEKGKKKSVRVDMDFYQTRVWEEKIKKSLVGMGGGGGGR